MIKKEETKQECLEGGVATAGEAEEDSSRGTTEEEVTRGTGMETTGEEATPGEEDGVEEGE